MKYKTLLKKFGKPKAGELYECILKSENSKTRLHTLLWCVDEDDVLWRDSDLDEVDERNWSVISWRRPYATTALVKDIRTIIKADMVGQKGTKYHKQCSEILEKLKEPEKTWPPPKVVPEGYYSDFMNLRKIIKWIDVLETYPRIKIKDMIFAPKNFQRKSK